MKDVLLVGFGAVGAIYSLILKRSGRASVTVIARGNFESISSHGMHFKSKKFGDIQGWRPDRLFKSVAEAADRPYSHVVVASKAIPEVMRTPTLLSPLLSSPYIDNHPQPTYVILQNGLNVEKGLYYAVQKLCQGEPKIISTALYIGTNLVDHNVVEHSHFDRLTMGIYRPENYTATSNTPEEQSTLDEFESLLHDGGGTVIVVPEVQRLKFSKNFWNVAFSSLATLTRYPIQAIFRHPDGSGDTPAPYVFPGTADLIKDYTLPNLRAILQELVNVGRALGFDETALPSSLVQSTLENTAPLHATADSVHIPSMLLDVEKGRPIEVEVIVGEVVRLARGKGVDIPRIETLYAFLLVLQNQLLRSSGPK
ncbi:hypothetical protein JAAARDRAFT_142356 [Jaapia argillacea MUCL 33604]|uniref:Ketopantoate reductase C-terminal domain-containing protein n=1 Tax=Jaapia argillacea MUCL 33604 TaxID=933084 RepID=A0A067PI97_9AGAM|nr:hypothetical protein JAAARDRAFT_142356 [Jaapia argillacea MUCL 33604]